MKSTPHLHLNTKKDSGFSLVQLIVAMSIFTVVIVAVGAFQVGIFSNQRIASGSLQTAQDAQIILRTILTELRSASPGMNGSYTIVSAGTSSISFFSDTNNDGKTDQIGYNLLQTTLYRTRIIPTSDTPPLYLVANRSTTTLMVNVRNASTTPVFQYFDTNYTGTSSPMALPINISAVRLIKINLTLDTDPKISPVPRTYSVQVGLRNLKTNL